MNYRLGIGPYLGKMFEKWAKHFWKWAKKIIHGKAGADRCFVPGPAEPVHDRIWLTVPAFLVDTVIRGHF